MSGSGSGSKADAGDTPEVLKAEIERGREAVRAGKFSDACDILSATLERYCLKYGELSKECAEAYLRYGIALTREVEDEEERKGGDAVFGAAVPKEVPTGVAPEEQQPKEEGGSSSKDAAAPAGADGEEGEEEEGEEGEEEEGEEGEEGEEEEEEEEEGEGQEGEGQEQEEGARSGKAPMQDDNGKAPMQPQQGDAGNESDDPLQLAWQVLDVSRSIFERDDTIEMYEEMGRSADRALMLSDAYANLGDINVRNEMFDDALADYCNCRDIREESLKPDDRLLIDVHFQLALSFLIHNKPDRPSSLASYRRAAAVCEKRIENLKTMMKSEDGAAPPADSSIVSKNKGETEAQLTEMEEILCDIRERIESEEIVEEGVDDALNGMRGGASSTEGGGSSSSAFGGDAIAALAAKAFGAGVPTTEPVKTLGVFGKKKKAPEEGSGASAASGSSAGAEPASKKAKTETDVSAAPTPAKEGEVEPVKV